MIEWRVGSCVRLLPQLTLQYQIILFGDTDGGNM